MNQGNWASIMGHGIAAVAVTIIPILITGLPMEWQTMTLAGFMGMFLKWAHFALSA